MKTRIKVLLPLLLLWALPAAVEAQFTFTTNSGAITITRYTGPGGAVTIPNMTNGLPVTSIGASSFYRCTSLTWVSIPNSVTNIGLRAFQGSTSLTSISIPDSVLSMGSTCFGSCSSLTNITLGSSVTNIAVNAFVACTSLMAMTVDTNNPAYSSLGGVWFNKSQTILIECPQGRFGSYAIPSSVTHIGTNAFGDCWNLTNVTIPSSVTTIADGALGFCTNLTTVTIPSGVIDIGYAPFSGCSSLMAITVDTNNPAYSSVTGVLFNKSQTTLIQCPGGISGSYIIPDGVTSIAGNAFYDCFNLVSITIPNGVSTIGNGAFLNCSSLTNVTIPGTVTTISDHAFAQCTNLTSIVLPNNVTCVGASAFFGCTRLTSIGIPNGVASIGGQAFAFTSLTSITLPNSVTNIGDNVFIGCINLVSMYFQGNAPTLGMYALDGASNATVYYLPGTTGWGATFGGRLTALWFLPNPLILSIGPSFGVKTNHFGFVISWATNLPVVVEACTNLANLLWFPVGTNTLTGGSSYFSDAQWTNYPTRLYRLRWP
jgi:hypothetical protein